ncbi:LysR substrate-binding domain-containing protein [Methylobacterium sp. NPDC080182]|uniref:LysR substrate-binding domain-containing protein n=1 Tax=Methylobacterium sp. NPDC080182 TaxID=3390590 RepID=UPI003CFCCE68
MRGLPPFDALVAFEAVLRHGSMTLAAAELGVTQSAVSHRLRRLEAFVGTPLLRRLHPGLQPTAAGLALAEGFAEVLAGMASLRTRCRAATGPERLQVGVGSAVAQYWLVRRLPAFMEAHPDTDVELVLLPNCDAVRAASLDVRLLWLPVTEARASSTRCLLPRETVFPVCRTDLLSREVARGDLTALLRLPLLHKGQDAGLGAASEWAWRTWFERLGYTVPVPRGLRLDDIGPAIGSAIEGAGAALVRSLLCADALAEGRLSRVLPPEWDMPSAKVQVATWSAAQIGNARVRAFVRWVVEAAERSSAALAPLAAERQSHPAAAKPHNEYPTVVT